MHQRDRPDATLGFAWCFLVVMPVPAGLGRFPVTSRCPTWGYVAGFLKGKFSLRCVEQIPSSLLGHLFVK